MNGRRCTAWRSAQKPGFCWWCRTSGPMVRLLTVCSSGFSELGEMPTSLVLSFTDHYHRNNNIKKKNILTGQTWKWLDYLCLLNKTAWSRLLNLERNLICVTHRLQARGEKMGLLSPKHYSIHSYHYEIFLCVFNPSNILLCERNPAFPLLTFWDRCIEDSGPSFPGRKDKSKHVVGFWGRRERSVSHLLSNILLPSTCQDSQGQGGFAEIIYPLAFKGKRRWWVGLRLLFHLFSPNDLWMGLFTWSWGSYIIISLKSSSGKKWRAQ